MSMQTMVKAEREVTTKWRERIQGSQILWRLIQCAEGTLELTHTQANTGLRLIDKILPSLQAVTVEQTVNHVGLQKHELEARLIALGQDPTAVWNRLAGNVVDVIPEPKLIKPVENQVVEEGSTPGSGTSESIS